MNEPFQTKLHNRIFMNRFRNRNMSQSGKRLLCIKNLVFGALLVTVLLVVNSGQVQSLLAAMRAPVLPELQVVDQRGQWLPQSWAEQKWGQPFDDVDGKTEQDDVQRYHHISQGTATLGMPYGWFVHLEEPAPSLWTALFKDLFFIEGKRFSRDDYLLRFGFIRDAKNAKYNPDGLPIGFAKSASIKLPGIPTTSEGIGFTCAACHTGHFIHGQGDKATEYIIEGGPATTDIGQLTVAIGAALGQTAISAKLPFFDNRFDRFARKVLGTQYSAAGKMELAKNIDAVLVAQLKNTDTVEVQEGFTRLDALNRIGNQVFWKEMDRSENNHLVNAPVSYPFLWTSQWFKWVQYDGSIMRPLIRNAGEAMGVTANVNMNSPKGENRFQSSIPMENLLWIEELFKGKKFNEGLTAPVWPLAVVAKTDSKFARGKELYQDRCQGCHLPVIGDPALDKLFKPIEYLQLTSGSQTPEKKSTCPSGTDTKEACEKVLDLYLIPQSEIGTDPAQGNVLVSRTINTSGNASGSTLELTKGVGLDQTICAYDPDITERRKLFGDTTAETLVNGVKITDGGAIAFGLGLGAIVQQTINVWFASNYITDPEVKNRFLGGRPNCFQVGKGYKARPLNGVWATAPFLHNGSVATLKDLICTPQEARQKYIRLGDISFDADKVGVLQPQNFIQEAARYLKKGNVYTKEGYFILDTTIPGNSNQGHSFSEEYNATKNPRPQQKKGVIGPIFSTDDCDALIDYLKTI